MIVYEAPTHSDPCAQLLGYFGKWQSMVKKRAARARQANDHLETRLADAEFRVLRDVIRQIQAVRQARGLTRAPRGEDNHMEGA